MGGGGKKFTRMRIKFEPRLDARKATLGAESQPNFSTATPIAVTAASRNYQSTTVTLNKNDEKQENNDY